MKKIIILLSLFLLGSANAGHAVPINHSDIFNLSYWTFNRNDGYIPSAKTLKALQLWDFWNFKYAFLHADANNFLWELNMSDVTLHKNPLKAERIKRKLVKALKEIDRLPIETSFDEDSYITLTEIGTSLEDVAASPIPEPAAMLLFGTGLAGLAVATRRKFFHRE